MRLFSYESRDFNARKMMTDKFSFVAGIVVSETALSGLKADLESFVRQLVRS